MNYDPDPGLQPYRLDVLQYALDRKVHAIELHALYRDTDGTVIWEHDQGDDDSKSMKLSDAIDFVLRYKGTSSTMYNDDRQFFLIFVPHATDVKLLDGLYNLLGQYAQYLSTAVNASDPPRGITFIISGPSQEFYARHSGKDVNRLCIVEGIDYIKQGNIVNRSPQNVSYQWQRVFDHPGERGQVNACHKALFNVRVWDADAYDKQRLALATGADSVNARSRNVDGDIDQFQEIIRHQAPLGISPSLVISESQAILVWRGASPPYELVNYYLYVSLGSPSLGFSRQINLTYFLEDQPIAQAPAVALSPKGPLMIVYEGTGAQRLWYITGSFTRPDRFITFDGQQHRLTLPDDSGRRGSNPSVAFGPDGRVIVVYEGTNDQRLWYVSGYLQGGVLEGTEYSLSQGDARRGYTPSIAFDAAGNVIVVYQGTSDQKLWYVAGQVDPRTGQILGTEFSLTEGDARRGFNPSVAIDSNGHVLIAYEGTDNERLWYVSGYQDPTGRINGTEFSLTEGDARRGMHPTVSFGSDGFATILYTGTSGNKLWYVRGTFDQTHRLIGQEQLLDMSLVE